MPFRSLPCQIALTTGLSPAFQKRGTERQRKQSATGHGSEAIAQRSGTRLKRRSQVLAGSYLRSAIFSIATRQQKIVSPMGVYQLLQIVPALRPERRRQIRSMRERYEFQSALRPCDRSDSGSPNKRSRKCFVAHFRLSANLSRAWNGLMSKNSWKNLLSLVFHSGAKPQLPRRHLWFAETRS